MPVGRASHRFSLSSSSCFTSPSIAHRMEVTPNTSTYCSDLKAVLLNSNRSTQRLSNLENCCIYL